MTATDPLAAPDPVCAKCGCDVIGYGQLCNDDTYCKPTYPIPAQPTVQALNAPAIAAAKAVIIAQAEAAHAAYPQYHGKWNGDTWKLARVKRRVDTKLGMAFDKGDLVIFQARDPFTLDGVSSRVIAYSIRNGVDTMIAASYLEQLEA